MNLQVNGTYYDEPVAEQEPILFTELNEMRMINDDIEKQIENINLKMNQIKFTPTKLNSDEIVEKQLEPVDFHEKLVIETNRLKSFYNRLLDIKLKLNNLI